MQDVPPALGLQRIDRIQRVRDTRSRKLMLLLPLREGPSNVFHIDPVIRNVGDSVLQQLVRARLIHIISVE